MRRSGRNNKGNMLIIVSVFMGLLGMGLIVGLSFAGLFFAQNILQNYANELALSGACVLNGGDKLALSQGINSDNREGQMNDMIIRTRVLVKESREEMDKATQQLSENKGFMDLADQLLTESKQSASDMEADRKTLKQVSEQEATQLINDQLATIGKFRLILPWIQLSSPRLVQANGIAFGQVKDMQSNVEQLNDANDLTAEDQSYVAANKHYSAGANARLMGPESYLDFKVSSLQPSLNKEVAPARLILPGAFQKTKNADDLTSSVEVNLEMDVRTSIGAKTASKIIVKGIATTTGASPIRRDESEFEQ